MQGLFRYLYVTIIFDKISIMSLANRRATQRDPILNKVTGDFGLVVQILLHMLTNRRACMHMHVHACTWDLVHDMRLSVLTISEKSTVNVQIGPQTRFMLNKSGANSVVDIASTLTPGSVPTTVTTSQVYMLLIVLLKLLMVDQNATTSFLN